MGAASASFTLPTFLRAKTFASNTFQSEPSFFVQGSPETNLKEQSVFVQRERSTPARFRTRFA